MKRCQFCSEEIQDEAIKCKWCGSWLNRLNDKNKENTSSQTSAPPLWTLNGIGLKLYGDTLYFVFVFIPILPIARYDVVETGSSTYRFYGKYKLHYWQKIWFWLGLTLIVGFVIYFMIQNESNLNSY